MVENISKIVCTECKSSGSSIFIDNKNGEVVCKNCGTVLDLIVWKNEIYD
jgi:transcription initiation factor TFIIIB Brf1 subunit/transcription initiation factor TFIIB